MRQPKTFMAVFILGMVLVASIHAQHTNMGRINGVVKDSGRAVVPDAQALSQPSGSFRPLAAYITNSVRITGAQVNEAGYIGSEKYGLGSKEASVSIVDTVSGHQAQVSTVPVGLSPTGETASPDGRWVYIAHAGSRMSIVDASTGLATGFIPVANTPTGTATHLLVDRTGARLYASNSSANTVSVIDTASRSVLTTLHVGTAPAGIALSSDGSKLYVTNSGSNTLSIIDTASNQVVGLVPVGSQPDAIAVSGDGATAYIVNAGSGTVSIMNTATYTITGTIAVGPQPSAISVTPDSTKYYVTNGGNNTVSVVSAASNAVVQTITVDSNPSGVAIMPGSSQAYVTNLGSNSVSIIDTNDDEVTGTVTVGIQPYDVVFAMLPAPRVTTDVPPEGTVNRPYVTRLTALGGVSPYTWSVTAGALPQGVNLESSGVLTGRPVVPGTVTFTVEVRDADGSTTDSLMWITVSSSEGSGVPGTKLSNGLVPVPPMGVNPSVYGSAQNEGGLSPVTLRATAEALVKPVTSDGLSLADLGYTLIQPEQMFGARTGPVDPVTGQPTLTPLPKFGSFDELAALIHEVENDYVSPVYHRHLQVGVYDDWGIGQNCAVASLVYQGYIGTGNGLYNHEVTDARTFASLGLSSMKLDATCGLGWAQAYGAPPSGFSAEMRRITDAFAQYAPGTAVDVYWEGTVPQYANEWRLGRDECGCFKSQSGAQDSVLDHLDEAVKMNAADLVGPGSWNDMDTLLAGGVAVPSTGLALTSEEQRSQFGIEALTASPLLTVNLSWPMADSMAMEFLTNAEVIAVDQDVRSDMARVVEGDIVPPKSGQGTYQVLSKVLTGSGERAVGLLNRSDSPMDITVHFNSLRNDSGGPGGLTNVTRVRDLWSRQDIGVSEWQSGSYTVTVAAHGIDILKVWGTSISSPLVSAVPTSISIDR